MLPAMIASLGGQLQHSSQLTDAELRDTDLLVLIHPLRPWTAELQGRVWSYVRRGGELLVLAEPWVLEDGKPSAFDEVLAPTAMRVRFDTAISETVQWQQSHEPPMHPASLGLDDLRDEFGLIQSSSIEVRWPARPMLVGRWGYSDPGSDATIVGVNHYEPGNRLGDLVLAAEQSFGRGRVVVLGDVTGVTNQRFANCYSFLGRLLGYQAGHVGSPQATGRQLLGLAGCLALVVLGLGRIAVAATRWRPPAWPPRWPSRPPWANGWAGCCPAVRRTPSRATWFASTTRTWMPSAAWTGTTMAWAD